jgi:hypothetical protein
MSEPVTTPSESARPRTGTLAFRVSLLAFSVGAAVMAMAAFYGVGGCSAPASGGPEGATDAVCYSLVRTLAERMGLVSAVATAVIVLMMVGLARTPVAPRLDGPSRGLGE